MIYIILILILLFLFGPLVLIGASLFLFRKRIKLFSSFSQIYETVYSMMKNGEFNFQNFQEQAKGFSQPNGNHMPKSEAAEILGVKPGSTSAEVNKAYHKLMQKIHPDKGGSDYLARQLNKARETLLK